jgi:hypothetical protein
MHTLALIGFSDNEHLAVIGSVKDGCLVVYSDCPGMEDIFTVVTHDVAEIEDVLRFNISNPKIFALEVIERRLDKITSGKFSRAYAKILAIYGRQLDNGEKMKGYCYYREHDMCGCM